VIVFLVVFLGKCPSEQMSSGQMSFWANVFLGKCPSGQMSYGQMSIWANVFWAKVVWANVLLGKCCLGKCPSGQTSYGQMYLGKCLWANVTEPYQTPTAAYRNKMFAKESNSK
jgi:hypothetical protein